MNGSRQCFMRNGSGGELAVDARGAFAMEVEHQNASSKLPWVCTDQDHGTTSRPGPRGSSFLPKCSCQSQLLA